MRDSPDVEDWICTTDLFSCVASQRGHSRTDPPTHDKVRWKLNSVQDLTRDGCFCCPSELFRRLKTFQQQNVDISTRHFLMVFTSRCLEWTLTHVHTLLLDKHQFSLHLTLTATANTVHVLHVSKPNYKKQGIKYCLWLPHAILSFFSLIGWKMDLVHPWLSQ